MNSTNALTFAGAVFAVVVLVRLAWVLLYNRLYHLGTRMLGLPNPFSLSRALVVSWCGMRGLVTLAAALALPASFPERDLIVLSALGVVLGTLVVQGLTLGPLIRWLKFPPDASFQQELSAGRVALIDAALASMDDRQDEPADRLRLDLREERAAAADGREPRAVIPIDRLRRRAIAAKRRTLADLRRSGALDDDVFHALEQELDWDELAASPQGRIEIFEG